MNGPRVVVLIYTVEHGNSVSYEDAEPLHYGDRPDYDLMVDNKTAHFEFKQHFADVASAREAVDPFIQHWEFDAKLRNGPNSFSLRAEVEERNPSPPAHGSSTYRLSVESPLSALGSPIAKITHVVPHYPLPLRTVMFASTTPMQDRCMTDM